MSHISIYAELLLNIRQICVVASLPTDSNETTSATLSSDNTSITVSHEGSFANITLPVSVRAGIRLTTGTSAKGRDLSFRLPAADPEIDAMRSKDNTHQSASTWPASSLRSDTEIACLFCSTRLVSKSVSVWKDLPSENWAEMMDFWHCHKPDVEGDDAAPLQNGAKKGYGAGSSIEPTAAVGLVDTTYLLLMRQDCNVSLEVNPPVLKNPVGIASDKDATSVKIYKWDLRIRRSPVAPTWEEPVMQRLICAQLLATMESQAVRKVVLNSENHDSEVTPLLVSIYQAKSSLVETTY
ncbi:MAG: hypothetical protein Q9220_003298 [cf. Caloplaca sp. 1 TL-2023]